VSESNGGPHAWSTEHRRRWQTLGDELRRRLGTGATLEPHVRARFEGRLGGDLSGVMVHRSPLGGHLARALGAQAVTAGQHVVGSAEDLDPSTSAGAALLGHELTHAVQRDTSPEGEAAARSVERALAAEADPAAAGGAGGAGGEGGGAAATGQLDLEALTERVYRHLTAELMWDRDRAAWVS
jgi:hypothetical protein